MSHIGTNRHILGGMHCPCPGLASRSLQGLQDSSPSEAALPGEVCVGLCLSSLLQSPAGAVPWPEIGADVCGLPPRGVPVLSE